MKNTSTPSSVFDAFRQSMLEKNDDWKELLSEEATLTTPLAEAEGREQFIEVHATFTASVRSSALHRKLVDGNTVAARATTTISAPGTLDLPLEISEWYTIEEGKVTALRTYFDASALRNQMRREHTLDGPVHR